MPRTDRTRSAQAAPTQNGLTKVGEVVVTNNSRKAVLFNAGALLHGTPLYVVNEYPGVTTDSVVVEFEARDADLLMSLLIDTQDMQTNHPTFDEDYAMRVARLRWTLERALRPTNQ